MRARWQHLARILGLAGALAALALPSTSLAQARELGSPARVSATTPRVSDATARSSSSRLDALGSPVALPSREGDVRFDIALATHVPVSVGVDLGVTFPYGILVRAHVGGTPEPYAGIVNEVAIAAGGYDRATGSLVSRAGGGAFVLRIEAGVRPITGHGFEILAGYTALFAGASIDRETFQEATGQRLPPFDQDIGISATLHALSVNVGWSEVLFDHLLLRGTIGWVHTVGAAAQLDVPQLLRDRMPIDRYEASIERAITTWGFAPEVRVAIGYVF